MAERDQLLLAIAHVRCVSPQVIDNDRLTLANLNRIKHLEAQLGEIFAQLDEQACTLDQAHLTTSH